VPEDLDVPPGVDPARPTPARMYDYFLGGSNNFEADRQLGERLRALVPEISGSASANRAFHQRAARWMAYPVGVAPGDGGGGSGVVRYP
jgi:hypothetical protein